MKYWEITADNLKKAGWSLGWVFVEIKLAYHHQLCRAGRVFPL